MFRDQTAATAGAERRRAERSGAAAAGGGRERCSLMEPEEQGACSRTITRRRGLHGAADGRRGTRRPPSPLPTKAGKRIFPTRSETGAVWELQNQTGLPGSRRVRPCRRWGKTASWLLITGCCIRRPRQQIGMLLPSHFGNNNSPE